jgi:hypothetical protein
MIKIILSLVFVFLNINANNLKEQTYTIEQVNKNKAIINKGNLTPGQSGIIVHNFANNKSIILTKAVVISSNKNISKIQFVKGDILKQDSIVTTNLKPKNGDDFILNHLHNISLLIAPNYDAYNGAKHSLSNNFIDIELFAAYLKINNIPVPKKEDFQKYLNKNNIGTLYVIIKNRLYIVDALSFKTLASLKIKLKNQTTTTPFYTNVQEIKTSTFNWFGEQKIKDYNTYYSNLLGLKNDRK